METNRYEGPSSKVCINSSVPDISAKEIEAKHGFGTAETEREKASSKLMSETGLLLLLKCFSGTA